MQLNANVLNAIKDICSFLHMGGGIHVRLHVLGYVFTRNRLGSDAI